MGSITKRGDLQYQAKVRRRGICKSKTFLHREDAGRWIRQTETSIDQGSFVCLDEARRTTLKDALDRYERDHVPSMKSQRSVKSTVKRLREALVHHTLANLKSSEVAKWIAGRTKEVSTATARRELSVLARVFELARKEWGIHCNNPTKSLPRPADARARDRRLRDGEFEAIIEAASESPELAAVVRLAVETAMRRSEIIGLHWHDIDLKKRTVRLNDTKNGESRIVPLLTAAVGVLDGLPRRISGRVFGIEPDSVTQAFARAVARARREYEAERAEAKVRSDPHYLTDLRFHDLRHEATSRLAERLPSVLELAAVTGHRDLKMLQRYYHAIAADLARKLE